LTNSRPVQPLNQRTVRKSFYDYGYQPYSNSYPYSQTNYPTAPYQPSSYPNSYGDSYNYQKPNYLDPIYFQASYGQPSYRQMDYLPSYPSSDYLTDSSRYSNNYRSYNNGPYEQGRYLENPSPYGRSSSYGRSRSNYRNYEPMEDAYEKVYY